MAFIFGLSRRSCSALDGSKSWIIGSKLKQAQLVDGAEGGRTMTGGEIEGRMVSFGLLLRVIEDSVRGF